uniref:Apelin n=1 Tax=Scleropages formosus TaxID=113540 RepID=A0A8C9RJN3_SCLFO
MIKGSLQFISMRCWGLKVKISPVSLLSAGPMATTERGKELEEEGAARKPMQQNPTRTAQNHRPGGWRRRRPRPRLSHKGPMPF